MTALAISASLLAAAAAFAWLAPEPRLPSARIGGGAAALRWKPMLMAAAGVAGSLALNNPPAAALSLAVAWLVDRRCRELEARERKALLDAQAEVALQMAAALHEATGDLVGALDKAADCVGEPLSSELKRAVADYRTGASLSEALLGLAARVPSRDVRTFVDGVLEAERFGADLATVAGAVAAVIRDRIALREELKSELRGQRLTVNVLLLFLPLMLGGSMLLFPQSKEIITNTFAGRMIVSGVVLAEYFVWALSTKGVVDEW